MKKLFIILSLLASTSFAARSILPSADGVGDLGASNQMWNNIYAYNLAAVTTNYIVVTNTILITSNVYSYTTNYVTNYVGVLNGSNITDATIGSNKLNFTITVAESDPIATNYMATKEIPAYDGALSTYDFSFSGVPNILSSISGLYSISPGVVTGSVYGFDFSTSIPYLYNYDQDLGIYKKVYIATGTVYDAIATEGWVSNQVGSASQSPWTGNINGAGYSLTNAGNVTVTGAVTATRYWYGTNAYRYWNGTGVVQVIP